VLDIIARGNMSAEYKKRGELDRDLITCSKQRPPLPLDSALWMMRLKGMKRAKNRFVQETRGEEKRLLLQQQ
jgi:hypothetical protein